MCMDGIVFDVKLVFANGENTANFINVVKRSFVLNVLEDIMPKFMTDN